MTWPLVCDIAHQVPDPGVPYLVCWILHWDWIAAHRSFSHFFEGNIFFPHHYSLAFSENLIGAALIGFPFFAAGVSTVAVYNALLLTGIALMGFSAWLLAFELTGDAAASVLCGVIFAFAPCRAATLQYFQLQWAGFLPLIFLFLIRYWKRGRGRDLVLFSVFFTWNALTCIYFGIFAGLGVLIATAAWLPGPGWKQRTFSGFKIGSALIVSALVLLPVYLPYFRASTLYGFHRSLDLITARSATWTSFLTGGSAGRTLRRIIHQDDNPEWQLFPGAVPLVVLAVGSVVRRKDIARVARRGLRKPEHRWIASMIFAGTFLALGGHTVLYRALYRAVPSILGAMRDPARAFNLALLALGALCAIAVSNISRSAPTRLAAAVTLLVSAAALGEFTIAPVNYYHVDDSITPLSRWLQTEPAAEAVLELPMKTADDIEYVFRSTEHDRRIVNGYSAFYPPLFVRLTLAVEAATDFRTLIPLIKASHASVLAFHIRRATPDERQRGAKLLASGIRAGLLAPAAYVRSPFDDCLIFRIFPNPGKSSISPTRSERAAAERALSATTAFIAAPQAIPPLLDAMEFSWPDFW